MAGRLTAVRYEAWFSEWPLTVGSCLCRMLPTSDAVLDLAGVSLNIKDTKGYIMYTTSFEAITRAGHRRNVYMYVQYAHTQLPQQQ